MAKLNLKNVRIAFVNVFERHQNPKYPNSKPAYKLSIILPKDHPQIDEVEEHALKACEDRFKNVKSVPKWFDRHYGQDSKECCVRDGDQREEPSPEFEDALIINAKRFKQPRILTSTGEEQTESGLTIDNDEIEGDEVYSGCMANVSVSFWAWDNENGKGLGCELLGVRFREDAPAFGGGSTEHANDDDLGDDEDSPRSKTKAKSKPKTRRDEDEEDDEDDRPRRSKSKSRRDDDEEEERPRSRSKPKSRRDDEEDDEDDEDEQPRRRRR